uniref:Putative methyltransferase n=1 Tax=viral metagenome TaxID=1070528 RepID=A0A6H1ZAD1_9ZZZZ
MTIKDMVDKKNQGKGDTGYDEGDFTKAYWTDPNANHYKIPRVHKPTYQAVKYFQHLLLKAGMKTASIVDIGAGAGQFVHAFKQKGFDAYGCEFSKSGREVAREVFGVNLNPCDLRTALPYETDAFDLGMCVGVLSMIPIQNMNTAISEILRVVRYGVLINVGCTIVEDTVTLIGNPHHITRLSPQGYWKIFNECGAYDLTSIQPPQKRAYGIGISVEFAGLFSKRKWEF